MTASKLYSDPPTEPQERRHYDRIIAERLTTVIENQQAHDARFTAYVAGQGQWNEKTSADIQTLRDDIRPWKEISEGAAHAGSITVKAAKAIDTGLRWTSERVGPAFRVGVTIYAVYLFYHYGLDAAIAFVKKAAE